MNNNESHKKRQKRDIGNDERKPKLANESKGDVRGLMPRINRRESSPFKRRIPPNRVKGVWESVHSSIFLEGETT